MIKKIISCSLVLMFSLMCVFEPAVRKPQNLHERRNPTFSDLQKLEKIAGITGVTNLSELEGMTRSRLTNLPKKNIFIAFFRNSISISALRTVGIGIIIWFLYNVKWIHKF